MFGTNTKDITNEFIYDNAPKKEKTETKFASESIYDDHPVNSYFRFKLAPNSEGNVIFLDDVTNFTEEQLSELEKIGLRQGISVHEHNINSGGKWRQYTCPNKGLRIDPRLRLYFMKQTRAWSAVGKALEEATPTQREGLIKALFTNKNMDKDVFNSIVTNAKQAHYFSDVLKAPLGSFLDCPICDEDPKKNRPSVKVFRTVIDLREWEDKDGNKRSNEMKLLVMSATYNKDFINQKRSKAMQNLRAGISGWEFAVQRNPVIKNNQDMSAACGTRHDLYDCHEIESLLDINDNALWRLAPTDLEVRLKDNHGFYALAYELACGSAPDVEKMCDIFGATDNTPVYIPFVPDYYDILSPKTPSFMNEFVLKKSQASVRLEQAKSVDFDDEIPF